MLARIISIVLVLFFSCFHVQAETQPSSDSFQRYFAQTRACLTLPNYFTCLPQFLDKTIDRPGGDLSQIAFIEQLSTQPELRRQLQHCFETEAQVVLRSNHSIVFVNKQMACRASKVNERWLLDQFYYFYID